jgi:aconitate hydratase A / 2-methylisocitrate dehydratase
MGVLPLQFEDGSTRKTLGLDGSERFDITGLGGEIKPQMQVILTVHRAAGRSDRVPLLCRIDTLDEVEYYRNGGILQYVLRRLAAA